MAQNPTIDLLLNHRSIRKFTDEVISDDEIYQLIQAGQAASTSSFIQATSVIDVKDSEKRNELVTLSGNQGYVATSARFLVFCADFYRNRERVKILNPAVDYSWTEQLISATVDVAIFAQNVAVAAESCGLGICYIGGIRNNPYRVVDLLNLPDLVYPVFGMCIGHPDQKPDNRPRLPTNVVCHSDRYRFNEESEALLDDYDDEVRQYSKARSYGKHEFTWREQMEKQSRTQSRDFMSAFLHDRGLAKK